MSCIWKRHHGLPSLCSGLRVCFLFSYGHQEQHNPKVTAGPQAEMQNSTWEKHEIAPFRSSNLFRNPRYQKQPSIAWIIQVHDLVMVSELTKLFLEATELEDILLWHVTVVLSMHCSMALLKLTSTLATQIWKINQNLAACLFCLVFWIYSFMTDLGISDPWSFQVRLYLLSLVL